MFRRQKTANLQIMYGVFFYLSIMFIKLFVTTLEGILTAQL